MTTRMRIDHLLVERGLFESRAKAQAAITAGLVIADGVAVRRPSDMVAADALVRAAAAHPWVSRGGVKLAAALDQFGFDPRDCICLDVGASTGGFTEVLLAREARRVYAVDVGRDQLHARLRERTEVVALEETDIRTLDACLLPESPSVIVVDVSFISLQLVLPHALALARAAARLVALIKPQYQVGRAHLKKGIVRDPQVQAQACDDIADVVRELGWSVVGVMESPIAGGDGNREFLIGATLG
jgi:23S rRNA (cytidine1920-2'-O)/16S rRNA (cytidine1409-2'-O)-methyltransferase